ncbi:MAG TPA: RNA polymerase sigma factor [Polyangiaceae bacterium]|nr:RNA polymerase sigma factor [Polyangiaceae bacterium]
MNAMPAAPAAVPAAPSLALREAISPTLPSLRARALRLTRSPADADDLVQETVLRALRFEGTFERGTNHRAWLHRILDSVFITKCRKRSREGRALGRFAQDPTLASDAGREPTIRAVSDGMYAALHALPEKFLEVVELVDLEDCSYREAADHLQVPVGTVMSRLFRARRLLETALGPEASGDVSPVRTAVESDVKHAA